MIRSIVMLVIGGSMLWVGITKKMEGSQQSVVAYNTVDQIDQEGPKWISLKKCVLAIADSRYGEKFNGEKTKEAYIPIVSENEDEQFYLQTKDAKLLHTVNRLIKLERQAISAETTLKMAGQDPKYLEMLKTDLESLKLKMEKAQTDLADFMEKNSTVEVSVKGMFDPSFELTNKEKSQLAGLPLEKIHIIKQNEKPSSGVYPWILMILGGLLTLGSLAQLFGKKKV